MGLDRFDSDKGYISANVVPACWTCNRMKRNDSWEDVLAHLQAIVGCSLLGDVCDTFPMNKRMKDTRLTSRVSNIQKGAARRNIAVSLTCREMEQMVQKHCVYCNGIPNPFNGIDRVDNKDHYSAENSVSCCTTCNLMKHTMSKEAFLAHVEKIINHKQ